jgi:uncharacterized protein YyaL (SSP411 family)
MLHVLQTRGLKPRGLLMGLGTLLIVVFSGCGPSPPAASDLATTDTLPGTEAAAAGEPIGATKPATGDEATGDEATAPEVPAPEAAAAKPPVEAQAEPDANPSTNRLASETSPYLRLHMHNPVDWYPWGEEAFAKARTENKLIFLSVGYSSCYWCHVMERESFMDQEIATFLNDHFVCIKVDREERPDVDSIYMLAVQLITRHGGWPMSVFLTPDAKPFFGGTYFPARDGDRPGQPGFLTVVKHIHKLWVERRETVEETATQLTAAVRNEMAGPAEVNTAPLDVAVLEKVTAALAASFDEQHGGFGYSADDPRRPKFPEASNLEFLLDRIATRDDVDCRRMLIKTLDEMAAGGIFDHVGGGFHRYSVDRYWHIPHFEKMLYDNGQLLNVYARAFQLTQDPAYRRVVLRTFEYLQREMRAPGGAYYAALDAESEKVEGKYYRWDVAEVEQQLGEEYPLFARVYGLDEAPNFEEHFHVLLRRESWREIAQAESIEVAVLQEKLDAGHAKLLTARNQRVRPLTDDKILCSWNGLTIRGLADAGRFCQQPDCTQAATDAALFVLENLRDEQGRLRRTYSQGEARLNAYLDDYAFLVDGLIALHQATGEVRWLDFADELTKQQIELFWDERLGGFFFTTRDHESLIARSKQLTDGAIPAGNSVAVSNLLYLAKHRQQPEYRMRAEQTVRNAWRVIDEFPQAATRMAASAALLLQEPQENDATK